MRTRIRWIQSPTIAFFGAIVGAGLWEIPTIAQTVETRNNSLQNNSLQNSSDLGSLAQIMAEDPEEEKPEETPKEEYIPVNQALIQDIQVVGSTVFSSSIFEAIVSPYEGKELTIDQLRELVEAVTQLYLNEGYYTSRAVYPQQSLDEGILTIEIQERQAIVEVEWLNENRLSDRYISDRIPAVSPLNVPAIEDQLRVLRDDPHLASVAATLRRDDQATADTLVVQAEEKRNFYGEFTTDNFSSPSLGGERLGVTFGLRNLSGFGDGIAANYNASTTGGYHSLDLNYAAPLNAQNGTLQLRGSFDFSKVTGGDFEDLNLRGERSRYEVSYRHPIRKTSLEEFALSGAFIYTTGTTFAFGTPTPFGFGANADGTTRTAIFRLSQEYLRRDKWGAWVGSSNFNFGLGILDATENKKPTPDSQFFSWLGQFQRVQRLSDRQVLLAQLDLQLSPNTLLPSDQFTIGGGQSIRGYRQNALIADNGFRFSVEDRITVRRDAAGLPTLQFAPFLDVGAAINTKNNPNSLSQNQNVLAGIGLGILWDPRPDLSIRLDYGYPLVDIEAGDNIQDHGLYFNSSLKF